MPSDEEPGAAPAPAESISATGGEAASAENVTAPPPVVAPDGGGSDSPEPVPSAAPTAQPAADDGAAAAHAAGLLSVAEPDRTLAEAPKAEAATGAQPEPQGAADGPEMAPEPLSYADHPLTLPDDVVFEAARLGEYDAILGNHRIPPAARQQLADLYAGDVTAMLDKVRRDQYDTWTKTRADWREDCAADPDFGGSAFETHKAAAIRMIEFAVPPDERRDFNLFLAATGAADHPQFFRFLNRLAQRFDAPAQPPSGIRPAPPQTQIQPRRLREFYRSNRTP